MALWGYMLNRSGRSKHYDQGIHLFDEGSYAQAIKEFQTALAEPKSNALTARLARFYLAESHSALARAQIGKSGADGNAIENLKAALAISPNYADLHFQLGSAYQEQKQYADALGSFDKALTINPSYARAHIQRAITLHALGRGKDALRTAEGAEAYQNALPKKFPEYLSRAKQAYDAGDLEELGRQLALMGKDDPNDAHHHAERALDYFRQGLLEEAIDEWQQAVTIAPRYADMRNKLGVTLYAARQDDEAVEQFTQALEINPRYIEARLNRGLALLRLERRDEARADFEHVLELERDNQAAREHLLAVDMGVTPP